MVQGSVHAVRAALAEAARLFVWQPLVPGTAHAGLRALGAWCQASGMHHLHVQYHKLGTVRMRLSSKPALCTGAVAPFHELHTRRVVVGYRPNC